MSISPRKEIQSIEASQHGGPNWAELSYLGLDPEGIIDFSVCTNPFPHPSETIQILSATGLNRYPDPEVTELREHLSLKLGVNSDCILVGNGATELIRLIALTYFEPGDPVLIIGPTFGEYEVACQIAGANVREQRAGAEDSFSPKLDEIIRRILEYHPKGIFICNPNNPTGQYLSRHDVEAIVDTAVDSLVILDEAYVSFVDGAWSSIDLLNRENVIILRSMTKDYALAGLRLGYILADREIVGNLHKVCPPWNVNVVAQKAGVIVLEDDGYLDDSKKLVIEAKQFLEDELRLLGFTLIPSRTNFFMVRVVNATKFRSALLRHSILVRDCSSFGLPEYVRIAPREMVDCHKLITVIRSLIERGELEANI